MCGIAGWATREPGADSLSGILDRMVSAIRHRGPDGHGVYQDEFAALGHRRLSIIDVAGGSQPIENEDGSLSIVYNGEIFNHAEIHPELERAGHRYRTRSDTETILHAYEQWGAACLDRLRGMFAFAIWDKQRRTLFSARDRLGKKPFYYAWDGRLLVFASEIKAILEHPGVSPAFESSALPEYLHFGYTSGDRTLFSGIRKLMPGHYLRLTPEGLEIQPYWELPRPAPAPPGDEGRWIRACRERLEEAVSTRLMSDVPLGMFLSGGLDSSAIAAIMRRIVAGPVKTFSVGYREAPYSELEYARTVASHIGTAHRDVLVSREDFFNALPRLVWHEDEPIAWPSSIPLYFVSRLAAEEVKVVLTGEGSDELFGGYARYNFLLMNQRWLRLYGVVPGPLRRLLRRFIDTSRLLSASARRKLQHTVLGRDAAFESLYLDNFYAAFSAREQGALLRSPGNLHHEIYGSYLACRDAAAECPALARLLYADQKSYLVELLMKQDQMSMAASIESRVPFLDHLMVEFAATVPESLKIRNGTGKYILKRAVEDLLPFSIIHRPKMGFPTPLRAWFQRPSKAFLDYLMRPDGLIAGHLDRAVLNRLLASHAAGRVDATDRIWRVLNLQIWGDLFLAGRRERAWEGLAVSLP